MKRILLASVASVFVIGSALAQQATPMPGMDMKGMDMKMMMSSPNDPRYWPVSRLSGRF